MIKLLKYLTKKDCIFMLISFCLIIVQVYLDLTLPDYMAEITMLVQTEGSEISEVLVAGGYMLACALGSLAASVTTGYFVARIAADLSYSLRGEVYQSVENFSQAEINRFSTSSLITRTTNDITQVQMVFAMGSQVLVKAPITAVYAIYKILGKDLTWTYATAGAVLVLLVLIAIVFTVAVPKSKRIQKLTDKLTSVTRENLTGIRVVRAYNAEKYQTDKFTEANDDLIKTNLTVNRVMALTQPGMMLIMSGLSLSIYWIGAYLIEEAAMPDKIVLFSDMMVFSSYAMQIIMSFMMLTMIMTILPRGMVAASRVNEVLNTKLSIKDGAGANILNETQGELSFNQVSFKYPDAENGEYALKDINFSVKRGETVAFIGATGSGKSTLVNLLPRFYDVTKGIVTMNGVDIREYKQDDLHNRIGYVPQKSLLFTGTVFENVAYGENGKDEYQLDDVKFAVEVAQGKDFVEKLDETYEAHIAQGGKNLSGGQKQRLSIARAICRKPEIYVFDDSFSALDYKTDKVLRAALKKETAGVTSLIVAQRIGTIIDADKIIVLDEGTMVGMGTHKELMENCRVYQEIAYSQLSEEELKNA